MVTWMYNSGVEEKILFEKRGTRLRLNSTREYLKEKGLQLFDQF